MKKLLFTMLFALSFFFISCEDQYTPEYVNVDIHNNRSIPVKLKIGIGLDSHNRYPGYQTHWFDGEVNSLNTFNINIDKNEHLKVYINDTLKINKYIDKDLHLDIE